MGKEDIQGGGLEVPSLYFPFIPERIKPSRLGLEVSPLILPPCADHPLFFITITQILPSIFLLLLLFIYQFLELENLLKG